MSGLIRRAKVSAQRDGLPLLFRKMLINAFWNSIGQLLVFQAVRKLEKKSEPLTDTDGLVDVAMSYRYLGLTIRPLQVKEEITELLDLVKELKPKYVLEIGTCSGGSLYLISRVAAPDAVLISVDLPGGNFGGGYPSWKVPLFKSFAKSGQSVVLIRGDSHDEKTVERVKSALRGNKVDFLFIDGDHTYGGVKKDFEAYSPLVRRGGIVALHDVAVDKDSSVGVSHLWMEIKDKHCTHEIINDISQGWAGIGVVRL